jgi:metal-responsive CopG/Arc/MetJ family transcriptional regulator
VARPDYHKDSPVTVRLPPPVLDRLDKRAGEAGVSRSALIIEAVTEKLDRDETAA